MLVVTEIDTEDTCGQQRLDGLGTVCAVQRGLALFVPRVGIGFHGSPFRVVPQQLDIESIETAGHLDVKSALTDLLAGADPCQGQEKAKVIGKAGVGTGDCLTRGQVFGLKIAAICDQGKFRLGLGRGWIGFQRKPSNGFYWFETHHPNRICFVLLCATF